jgi:hypothetical protein
VERVIYVETLSRRGRVVSRSRLSSFPATIGRAYSNDIIVDDKFVCPQHLRVSCDGNGEIRVEDLESVNGLYLLEPLNRVSSANILPEEQVCIGDTVIRFRGSEYEVEPSAVARTGKTAFPGIIERRWSAGMIFLACFVWMVSGDYLENFERITVARELGNILLMISLFAVWAGIWALINRLITHAFNFLPHMAVTGIASAGLSALMVANGYYAFMFSPSWLQEFVQVLVIACIPALLLYGHMRIISTIARIRCIVTSTLLALCILSFAGVIQYNEHTTYSYAMKFASDLKPVGDRWIRDTAPDEFFKEALKLKEKVDALAKNNGR